MHKVAIIGAGRVGETAAQFLAKEDLFREIALLDIHEGAAEGAALDLQEAASVFGFGARVTGSTDPEVLTGAELVIITAGQPRKPGMTRSQLLESNAKVIDQIVDDVVKHAPQALLMVVSNPVDGLTYRAWQRSGWPRNRVFGQAGVLDSSRMATFIAMETGLSVRDINAMVLGGHGDSMVPMVRYTTVSGVPVSNLLDAEAINRIIERTRHGGAEVLSLRGVSSAYIAPGAAVFTMARAIAGDHKQLLPSVVILQNEYGASDVAMGVPCVLGKAGVERVVELTLTEEERQQFENSLNGVRTDIARLKGEE